MSDQEDDAVLLEAIKSGAFLALKTPLTMDALGYVRQDVIRDRIHKRGKCVNKNTTHNNETLEIELRKKHSGSKRKLDISEQMNQSSQSNSESSDYDNPSIKKRTNIVWTTELCLNFDNALKLLGEGSTNSPVTIFFL